MRLLFWEKVFYLLSKCSAAKKCGFLYTNHSFFILSPPLYPWFPCGKLACLALPGISAVAAMS